MSYTCVSAASRLQGLKSKCLEAVSAMVAALQHNLKLCSVFFLSRLQ
jgi:hypothetical protein